MVFIDGETWPPSLHGTGTEEIFGGGACPASEYAAAHHGFHLIESPDYAGLIGAYRWFVQDPIRFARSLRWTVEHGHANNFVMAPPTPPAYEEARTAFFEAVWKALPSLSGPELLRVARIGEPFYAGRYEETRALLRDGV